MSMEFKDELITTRFDARGMVITRNREEDAGNMLVLDIDEASHFLRQIELGFACMRAGANTFTLFDERPEEL